MLYHRRYHPTVAGFTLIELSIVIVILSLIVGGILSATSFRKNSEAQLIIADAERYRQAISSFRMKYGAIPGDFTGAVARWNNVETTADGNGNGVIATDTEGLRAWQHMKLGDTLDNGNYTGSGALELDVNLPKSAGMDGMGWQLAGGHMAYTVNHGNALLFGKLVAGQTELSRGAVTSRVAYAIEEKVDDLNPAEGTMLAVAGKEYDSGNLPPWDAPGCTDKLWDEAAPVAFRLNDAEGLCYLVFPLKRTDL